MSELIPAINAETFQAVSEKMEKVKNHTTWVHLDIADGTFTKNILWHNSEDLKKYLEKSGIMPNVEAHLMIENPEKVVDKWISSGVKRIIVHVETIKSFEQIKQECNAAGVELMIAIAPDTPGEALTVYFDKIKAFQVLCVHPGLPGQLFIESSYDKIKYIRTHCPDCDIEVDGGIKVGIARMCIVAGANIFVAASAIFGSDNIKQNIENLKKDIS